MPDSFGYLHLLKQIGHRFCEFPESLLLVKLHHFYKVITLGLAVEMEASGVCAVRHMALSTMCIPTHYV